MQANAPDCVLGLFFICHRMKGRRPVSMWVRCYEPLRKVGCWGCDQEVCSQKLPASQLLADLEDTKTAPHLGIKSAL